MLTIYDVLEYLIMEGPGRTEAELAEAIFGKAGYHHRVSEDCYRLTVGKKVERRGAGGYGDPFRYYPGVATR